MNTEPEKMNTVDIVLSIYNQEKLIERVLYGIFKHTTTPFTLILIFDGCTDKTKPRAVSYIARFRPPYMKDVIMKDTPNIYETRANNVGYKLVTSDFFITLQDDMVIAETGWERRLTFPLRTRPDLIAVSSRFAQDIVKMDATHQEYEHSMARERGTLPRNICAVRDVINRGPIAFRTEYIKALNYLNEDYAPSDLDDADLSLRAWRDHSWKVGAFWIGYLSRPEWGKTRAVDSTMNSGKNSSRNQKRLGEDHRAYIDSGEKHDEDIQIEENAIDYVLHPNTPACMPYRVRWDRYYFRMFLESKIPGLHKIFTLLS